MWKSRRYTNNEDRKNKNNCYKCKYIKFNGDGYTTCTFRNANVITTEAYICDKYEKSNKE